MINFRDNTRIEAAVNRGLVTSIQKGIAAGATVMRNEGVPLHVGVRVLAHKGKRRKAAPRI